MLLVWWYLLISDRTYLEAAPGSLVFFFSSSLYLIRRIVSSHPLTEFANLNPGFDRKSCELWCFELWVISHRTTEVMPLYVKKIQCCDIPMLCKEPAYFHCEFFIRQVFSSVFQHHEPDHTQAYPQWALSTAACSRRGGEITINRLGRRSPGSVYSFIRSRKASATWWTDK